MLDDNRAVPIAPSLEPALLRGHLDHRAPPVDSRLLWISGLAVILGLAITIVGRALLALIGLITNVCFFGTISTRLAAPTASFLGPGVIVVPVLGAIIIGFMARYGSHGIRGHGIPEAMEQVLTNDSRIPARITLLKPVSAAISIGTGGPFGAEGPIIATGAALGSLLGQWIHVTNRERKTLLAAGAAAGMSAVFGSPLSAILLAIELLLFEFSIRSLVPVAVAAGTAAWLRSALIGFSPMFPMPVLAWPSYWAIGTYLLLGIVAGILAVGLTRLIYITEDLFARLPLHWMWWPALGAAVVGVIGYFSPRTFGVGYRNITDLLSMHVMGWAALILVVLKAVSWIVALSSGTSGGTLAPLLTIGAGAGAVLGSLIAHAIPTLGVDPRMAALVVTGALFAGASRALFMSVVFVLETTWQMSGLLPLLVGCTAAYLASGLLMRNTIMTEKIARRGVHVPTEYHADLLLDAKVEDHAICPAVALYQDTRLTEARQWLLDQAESVPYKAFPVVDRAGLFRGFISREEILQDGQGLVANRVRAGAALAAQEDLRTAAEIFARGSQNRLGVVSARGVLVGVITRNDVARAYKLLLQGGNR